MTTWETQSRKFATMKKLNLELCLPEFIATKIVTWKYHVEKFINGRYNMILGRDLLAVLGLDLKFSDRVIFDSEGPYEG